MTENRFPNFSPQPAVPPSNGNQQQNFNPIYNMNSKERLMNNNVPYQRTSNPEMVNSFSYQNAHFSPGPVRHASLAGGDSYFLQSNNIVASNPFEICPSSKNIPPSYHTQAYQVPRNQKLSFSQVPPPQQISHLPQTIPSYYDANQKIHCSNEIPFQNCSDSTVTNNASSVPQVFTPSSSSHDGSEKNCSVQYFINDKLNPNLNVPPQWNKVPSQLGANKSVMNTQFPHNPSQSPALSVPHNQINLKPNFSLAESNGASMKQAVSFSTDVNHRPVHPYLNHSNTHNGPTLSYNSQSPFPFGGNPPPNATQLMLPTVTKPDLNSNQMSYPYSQPIAHQNFSGGPVVSPMPLNPYTVYSPMSLQSHSIPMQVPNMTSFPPPPCITTFSKPPFIDSNFQLRENIVATKLSNFLLKFQPNFSKCHANKSQSTIAIAEFRSKLKMGFSVLKTVNELKSKLAKSIQIDESLWNFEVRKIYAMKDQLLEICNFLTDNVELVYVKLRKTKRKRDLKRKQKILQKVHKEKCKQERLELHQKIDRMLDLIKEKNLKLKRETEMKKEADDILSEVRRKIHEAKRTLEKLKAFEKLRNARKENALQKSHFVLPSHDANFDEKVSTLRNTMLKQLCDYEAEETALKVMLETEQEGQLEEEALWRLKRLKQFQKKKQKDIQESLFGTSEEPHPTDPLFLFYEHYNAGSTSVENLVQIRKLKTECFYVRASY